MCPRVYTLPEDEPTLDARPSPAHDTTIGVRALRRDLANTLRRVRSGQTVTITVGGVPSAVLSPSALTTDASAPEARHLAMAELARRGLVAPPDATLDANPIELPTWAGIRIDHLLREVRGR